MSHNAAEVYLWGTRIGIIYLPDHTPYVSFEYDRNFIGSGIELSPINMPLSGRVYSFPDLALETFHGVPGLLADSLPDRFGNAVINQWLAERGRTPDSFNVIERLCYTGKRGMGALEYVPTTGPVGWKGESVDIGELVELASDILKNREAFHLSVSEAKAGNQLLQLGTSAGGARAKAIIAWNEETGDIRSGQIAAGDGYGYWLIKFDGVRSNGDHGLEDEPEYTLIEYAYHKMATDAGISMNECRILEENGRHHFMTRRFDRKENGDKLHMQTLGALAHLDYNVPGLCSYEQMGMYARRLGLAYQDLEQLYRRMVFNVLAVNQDDHVKNFSFLMDRSGKWSLSPAYDMTFAYDVGNKWLSAHQMSVGQKTKNITVQDMIRCGKTLDIKPAKCKKIIEEIGAVVGRWPEYAGTVGIKEKTMETIWAQIQSETNTVGIKEDSEG